jgi:hypothetical protein
LDRALQHVVDGLVMNATDARALTDRIKVGVEACWELIKQAYTERAWAALGYDSWDDYCTREFGTARLRLPREERAEVVASLRESGLSLRAIESATGISRKTVIKDLATTEVVESTPPQSSSIAAEPDPADELVAEDVDFVAEQQLPPLPENYLRAAQPDTGQGCEYDPCASPDPPPEQQLPPAKRHGPAEPESKPITGTDGKTYSPTRASTPKEPRRRPIGDVARDLGLDLAKLTKRLEDLGADDRLGKKRDEVAPRLDHLSRVLLELAGRLGLWRLGDFGIDQWIIGIDSDFRPSLPRDIRPRQVRLIAGLLEHLFELLIRDAVGHRIDSLACPVRSGELRRGSEVRGAGLVLIVQRSGQDVPMATAVRVLLPLAEDLVSGLSIANGDAQPAFGASHKLGGVKLEFLAHADLLGDLLNRRALLLPLHNLGEVMRCDRGQ